MKRIITILFFGLSFNIWAQQNSPNISFNELSHDFGKIKEEGGTVTHKFEFTNTGASPLIIQGVKASCGCTTPDWTKVPVKPGEKGFVSATYNPLHRPGNFNKSITVTSNAIEPVTRLIITGNVEPKVQTIEDIYRFNIGGLGFNTNSVGFGIVYKDQVITKEVEYINSSDTLVSVEVSNVPGYISVEYKPQIVKPQEKGTIAFTMDASKNPTWGHSYLRLNVIVNGKKDPKSLLTVSAKIEEDFSKLTPEEKAKAAHIEFESTAFDFGSIKQGESVEHLFEFTNTGKSDLIIRNVKASCGCTAVKPATSVIKPGESSNIKAIFNTRGRKGSQTKTITVIVNDPVKPVYTLTLKGVVEVPVTEQK
ncbi:MAG: DUF1573 domain-containing protein [Bacteroidales bacterium]|nr:DUF1573 domain-containing protein [Bacteroidales bacterium]